MIVTIISIALVLAICIVLFPTWYICELALSFPLYLALGYLILAILVWFVHYIRFKRFFSGFFLILTLYFVHMVTQFYDHGYHKGCTIALQNTTLCQGSGLQILFMNIRKDNYNYSGLIDLINTKNPDVLMMVEYADHHDDALSPLLHKHYPYSNRYSRSIKHIGTIVYSKYPIDNLIDDYPQGGWRYGYFSLHYHGVLYYIYMVHTSSPVTYANFLMRNRQLEQIVREYQIHREKRPDGARVLLVGDFNLTPWSIYYDRFVENLDVYNASRMFSPILFTRRIYRLPLIWAHIDQLFVQNIFVERLQSLSIPGSDHRAYSFTIR